MKQLSLIGCGKQFQKKVKTASKGDPQHSSWPAPPEWIEETTTLPKSRRADDTLSTYHTAAGSVLLCVDSIFLV